MSRILLVAMAVALVLGSVAAVDAGTMSFGTPQETFNTWMDQMEQNIGKHEYVKICYSEDRLAEITRKTKDPAGVRQMDAYHGFLVHEMADYIASEPEEISGTEAVMKLTHKETGKTAKIRFVLEGDAWKIDKLPAIGSERTIGAHMFVILGVVCLIIIIVLAKKVLLT